MPHQCALLLAMTGGELSNHFEAPQSVLVFLGSVGDTDALIGDHFALEAVVNDIEVFTADVLAV